MIQITFNVVPSSSEKLYFIFCAHYGLFTFQHTKNNRVRIIGIVAVGMFAKCFEHLAKKYQHAHTVNSYRADMLRYILKTI